MPGGGGAGSGSGDGKENGMQLQQPPSLQLLGFRPPREANRPLDRPGAHLPLEALWRGR